MTLNAKEGFYGFFGDFGLWDTFQEQFAPKLIKIDMDKLCMKFSALNVDFNGLSLDFLGSKKPANEGIKERDPRKSRYLIPLLASNCYKLSRVSWALAQISCKIRKAVVSIKSIKSGRVLKLVNFHRCKKTVPEIFLNFKNLNKRVKNKKLLKR